MNDGLVKISRALISVTNKNDVEKIAETLQKFGCEIVSTGGTGEFLKQNKIKYTEISEVTGNPEAFGGRMKTISFAIESALLFDREKDKNEAEKLGIKPIDLVICNLYNFKKALEEGLEPEKLVDQIDIGGPTMIRAGAKNYKYVAVVTSENDYNDICEELEKNSGALCLKTRKKLSAAAFNLTADYDSLIATSLDKLNEENSYRIAFKGGQNLKYGENSHQQAMVFKERNADNSFLDIESLNDVPLSYNNMLDINAAIETVTRLNRKAAVVIKHNNPCGSAESDDQKEAIELAWSGDPVSAFGGIVAFNSQAEIETLKFFAFDDPDKSKVKFIEIIIAPSYSEEALNYLSAKKNLRIIKFNPKMSLPSKDLRYLNGLLLVQEKDNLLYENLDCVTDSKIDIESNKNLIDFGLNVISQIKSNAIAIAAKMGSSIFLTGMGAGQPNRLNSIALALERDQKYRQNHTGSDLTNTILFSDAFFPFEDNIELINKSGIKTIVQPGGSIRDKKVISKCNEFGITMVLTGIRHFKH